MLNKNNHRKGAAMILVVLFFIIISTSLLIGISLPISNQIKNTNEFLLSKSSYNIADSQSENALYRFNKGKIDAPESLNLLGSITTTVLTNSDNQKILTVEGSKSLFKRYVRSVFKTVKDPYFNYAAQVGDGGLIMEGSSHIVGDVYSTGDIVGNGGEGWYETYVSGSAVVGGEDGNISNMGVGIPDSGSAWANNIVNTTVSGDLKCKTGTDNNKTCDTSFANPVILTPPISQSDLNIYKNQAETGGSTTSINISDTENLSLGPIKINGNLNIENSGKLYITGPIYVTGNITAEDSSEIYTDTIFSTSSAILMSDGSIVIEDSATTSGSEPGSYVMLISNKSCNTTINCKNNPSIHIEGASAGAAVLYAINGGVLLDGSANVKAVVSKFLYMKGSSFINYESNLANINFITDSSGLWIKKSWKEVFGWE